MEGGEGGESEGGRVRGEGKNSIKHGGGRGQGGERANIAEGMERGEGREGKWQAGRG